MLSKSFVDTRFYLHEKESLERLVQSEGFDILNPYGDYSHGGFEADKSPFMIWVLGNSAAPDNCVERTP